MKQKLKGLTLLVVLLMGIAATAHAGEYDLNGGNWDQSASWADGAVPELGPDDTVNLKAASDMNIASMNLGKLNFETPGTMTLSQDMNIGRITVAEGYFADINLQTNTLTVVMVAGARAMKLPMTMTGDAGGSISAPELVIGGPMPLGGGGLLDSELLEGAFELLFSEDDYNKECAPFIFTADGATEGMTNVDMAFNNALVTMGTSSDPDYVITGGSMGITNSGVMMRGKLNNVEVVMNSGLMQFAETGVMTGTNVATSTLTMTGGTMLVEGKIENTAISMDGADGGRPTMTIKPAALTPAIPLDGVTINVENGAVFNNYGKIVLARSTGDFDMKANGANAQEVVPANIIAPADNVAQIMLKPGSSVAGSGAGDTARGRIIAENGGIVHGHGTLSNIDLTAKAAGTIGLGRLAVLNDTVNLRIENGGIVALLGRQNLTSYTMVATGTDNKQSVIGFGLSHNPQNYKSMVHGQLTAQTGGTGQLSRKAKYLITPWNETDIPETGGDTPHKFIWQDIKDTSNANDYKKLVLADVTGGSVTFIDDLPTDGYDLDTSAFVSELFDKYFELNEESGKLVLSMKIERKKSYQEFSNKAHTKGVAKAFDYILAQDDEDVDPELKKFQRNLDQNVTVEALNFALESASPASLLSAHFIVHEATIDATQEFSNYLSQRRRAMTGKHYSTKLSIDPNENGVAYVDPTSPNALAQVLPETPGERHDRRTDAMGMDKVYNVFARVTTGFTRVGSSNTHIGLVSRRIGTVIGFDMKVHENIIVGFGASYNHNDVGFSNSFGRADIDSYRFGPYALMYAQQWFFETELSFGINANRFVRNVYSGGERYTPKSRFTALDFTANIGGGYDFKIGQMTLTPRADLQYQYYHSDGFKEREDGGIGYTVNAYENSSLTSRIGLELAQRFEPELVDAITPFLNVGWRRDWISPDDLETRLSLGNVAFKTYNDLWSRDSVYFGCGTTIEINDQLNCDLLYQVDIGDRQNRSQNAYFSLRYKF